MSQIKGSISNDIIFPYLDDIALNVKDYGDNSSDLGEKFNLTYAALPNTGGTILIPPGEYTTSTELNITTYPKPLAVWGYGVIIKTIGAISGLKIDIGGPLQPMTIYGLKIHHDDNADATYGFDLSQNWNTKLRDCIIVANAGVSPDYAAISLSQTIPGDNTTGCFWTSIEGVWIRATSGAGGKMPIGILLKGAANATTIRGGGINTCTTSIKLETETGQIGLPNALLVDGVAFEVYTTAIHCDGAVTSNIAGHRYIKNRFETGTTIFSYTTTTTQPSQAPFAMGNMFVSNAGAYLNNPNNLYFNSLDMSITPDYDGTVMTWRQPTKINVEGGTALPLVIVPQGGSRGIHLRNNIDTGDVLQLMWSGFGVGSIIRANIGGTPNLQIDGVKGISGAGGGALPNNLRGQATFAGAATVAVSFGTAEPDTSYLISIGAAANENIWWTTKTVNGFTLNSSNAGSTAVVDWHLIR